MKITKYTDYGTLVGIKPDATVTYTFDNTLMVDDFEATRPGATAPVSGGSGAFDFYTANPRGPLTVTKRWAVTKTTSAAIDDERMLISRVVALDRGILFAQDRDGTTEYWTRAKIVAFSASETYQEKGRFLKNFELTFLCQEGVWYIYDTTGTAPTIGLSGNILYDSDNLLWADYLQYHTVTLAGDVSYTGSFTVSNAAYINSPVMVLLENSSTTNYFGDISITVDTTGAELDISSDIGTDGFTIGVATDIYRAYKKTAGGTETEIYDNTTIGDGQIVWLWLAPGTNTISYTISMAASATAYLSVYWRHIYDL